LFQNSAATVLDGLRQKLDLATADAAQAQRENHHHHVCSASSVIDRWYHIIEIKRRKYQKRENLPAKGKPQEIRLEKATPEGKNRKI